MSEEAGSLTEEIVYIINVAAGSSLVESMIRLKRRESSAKGEFSIVVELKPVVRETIARYWTGGGTGCRVPHSEPRTASDQLEATFSDLAKDKLSLREQTVVSFLLAGTRPCGSPTIWESRKAQQRFIRQISMKSFT